MKTLAPQMTTNDPNRAHVWTDLTSSVAGVAKQVSTTESVYLWQIFAPMVGHSTVFLFSFSFCWQFFIQKQNMQIWNSIWLLNFAKQNTVGRKHEENWLNTIFSFCSHNVIHLLQTAESRTQIDFRVNTSHWSSALCRRHSHFEIKFPVWLGWQQSAAVTELEFAVG